MGEKEEIKKRWHLGRDYKQDETAERQPEKEKSELFLKSCLNYSNNPELFFMAWDMAKGRRIHSLVIQLVFTCNSVGIHL